MRRALRQHVYNLTAGSGRAAAGECDAAADVGGGAAVAAGGECAVACLWIQCGSTEPERQAHGGVAGAAEERVVATTALRLVVAAVGPDACGVRLAAERVVVRSSAQIVNAWRARDE